MGRGRGRGWTSMLSGASRVVIYGQFVNIELISDKETP